MGKLIYHGQQAAVRGLGSLHQPGLVDRDSALVGQRRGEGEILRSRPVLLGRVVHVGDADQLTIDDQRSNGG